MKLLLKVLTLAATVSVVGCRADGANPSERLNRHTGPRRIDVAFLGHVDTLPDARRASELLAAALGKFGINVHYVEAGDSTQRYDLYDAAIARRDVTLAAFTKSGDGRGLVFYADSLDVRGEGDGGRVFRFAKGRTLIEWGDSTFQQQLRDAILAAAGDRVRAQLQAYALPVLQYQDPPVLIPNYENQPEAPRLQLPLGPEEALKYWQVPPGFRLQLFAAEPQIVNPIALSWDERGRLWVVETVDYPNNIRPDGEGNDVIRILEDTDGDGRADKSTVFADKLSIPTGIVFSKGGIIVSNAPRFLFLQDTDGDDRADVRREIFTGWSAADTHSGPSNLHYGFDNWIWGAVGDAGFNGTVGGKVMQFEDAIYRMRPDGSQLEVVTRFSNNTWSLGFSEAFDVFANSANNEHSVHIAIPNRYYEGVTGLRGSGKVRLDGHYARHAIAVTRQVDYFGGFTAAGGHSLYTARSFPREYWNRIAFVHEAVGGLVHNAILERAGSGFRERDGWNLLASADEWAAPVHAQVGPDGAVWILDWYSFIKQHNPTPPGFTTGAGGAYDTPLRDKQRGRIYRLVWRAAPHYKPLQLSADRPEQLIETLRNDNMFWRMTAQRLLVDRGQTDVVDDLYSLIRDPTVDQTGLDAGAVHALWTLHGLGQMDGSNPRAERVVRQALNHPSAAVRKNALMVLPKNEQTFEHIRKSLNDRDLNVRLHALLAVAELPSSDDIGRALYALGNDRGVLEDQWLPTALYLAARRHSAGFLDAYSNDAGASVVAQLTERARRGELENVIDWSQSDFDDAAWDTVQVPAHWTTTKLAHFPGVVWFRHAFDLPAHAAGRAATLHLGPISDADVSYVNGVRVGAMSNVPGERRVYNVPAGVLRAGRNVVAVEVTNERRGGGIYGTPDSVFITGPNFKVPLAASWKYRKAAEWTGGRAPDFAAGLPFAQQFLRVFYKREATTDAQAPAQPPDVTLELSTVPGQNRFDKTTLTARAGQRVAIRFSNSDAALHNVVVIASGQTQQEVGAMLNAYVADASAAGRDFIPPRVRTLAASPMVSPRQSATVTFNVPDAPGDYPFVCTVPGHWVTMWGVIRVQ
ncbi:MAG: PVC-type heme-binding CxxCH protein [Longimicrobiales bacterium]